MIEETTKGRKPLFVFSGEEVIALYKMFDSICQTLESNPNFAQGSVSREVVTEYLWDTLMDPVNVEEVNGFITSNLSEKYNSSSVRGAFYVNESVLHLVEISDFLTQRALEHFVGTH